MSVWVCGCRKVFFTADDLAACAQNIEGQCSFVLKPCSAVEYATANGCRKLTFTMSGDFPRFVCLVGDDDEERLKRKIAKMGVSE